MPHARFLYLLGLIVLVMAAPGCKILGSESSPTNDIDRLEKEIIELIGDAQATSVNQCRAIAFGSKPCGGPWRYLVYSTLVTDTTQLQSLVDRYNTLDAQRNEEEGLASDCAFVTPPTLTLEGSTCSAN